MKEYKTLEQLIQEAWAKKGLKVIEERVRVLKHGRTKWTIIAVREEQTK